jgi:hypothetical protein
MHKNTRSQLGIFNARALVAFALCSAGVFLAMLSFAATPLSGPQTSVAKPLSDSLAIQRLKPSGGAPAASMPLQPMSGPGWSIVNPTLAPNKSNNLNSLACVSVSDCWAVGNAGQYGPATLIEHWDGHSWSIISSPNNPPGGDMLSAVTCVSASDCWAVGNYYIAGGGVTKTLTEHWDGNSWSIVLSPNGSGGDNYLYGVTCVSGADCWAVGTDDDGTGFNFATLVEHWNGSSWSIVGSQNAGTRNYNKLFSVACASMSECWAVGYYANANGINQTLIELWNGSSWVVVPSPNKSSSDIRDDNFLSGVTCVSSSNCWAVGNFQTGGQTLIEHWDGSTWSIVNSPDSPLRVQFDGLGAVTCASASDCWATGGYQSSTTAEPFMEHWDGTSWSVVSVPNTSNLQNNYLSGIACISGSQCWSVGNYSVNGLISQTLIEHWDGTGWTIMRSPNNDMQTLSAVTCLSSSDCWAVGAYPSESDGWQHALFDHWDGRSWTAVTTPFVNGNYYLNSVTCTSSSQCWAAGYYFDPVNNNGFNHTVVERWDGTSWTIVSSPNTSATQNNVLNGVTCSSVADCWAVGYYDSGNSVKQTLIEHWDGNLWRIVTSPNTLPVESNLLSGIACASASECWAVGDSSDPSGKIYQTLIEQWNGTSWSIVSSPNTLPVQSNFLSGVACSAVADCWAVGYFIGNAAQGGANQTLIEHWNGTSWSIATSPNTSTTQNNLLLGVTCPSASQCWAVGYFKNDTGISQTLIEEWNGTSWGTGPFRSPNTNLTQNNLLLGVTCPSASQCWAVGYYKNDDAVSEPLIEEYSVTVPPVARAVSTMGHGSAGSFDVDLPLTGTRGVECRTSSALGAGNYTVLFTFLNDLTSVDSASVTTGTASISSGAIGPNQNQYTVNLTGVANAQYVTVTLNNVLDSQNNTGNVIGPQMGVLIGDVNASGRVDAADVSSVRQQTLQTITTSNFRNDINTSGRIDAADVSSVRQQTLTSLPTPP